MHVSTFAPHLHFACQPPRPFVLQAASNKVRGKSKPANERAVPNPFVRSLDLNPSAVFAFYLADLGYG